MRPGATDAQAAALRVAVFPCGNPDRGDDAAAVIIAREPLPVDGAGVEVRDAGDLTLESLVDLPAGTRIVVVDALIGPAPGAIVTVPLEALDALEGAASATSSHVMSLGRLIGLAGVLRGAPLDGVVVGIGAAQAWPGAGLSAPVAASIGALRDAVATAVEELRRS